MAEPPGPVLVVIPTYDERDNIAAALDRLRTVAPEADVLIVDDASPDGTGELAERLAADDDRVQVLHRPGKGGLGAAYLAGFAHALAGEHQVVVEMDADGSHAPEDLPALLRALDDADVVLGSRYVPGGRVVNWPAHRAWLSRGGNLYSRLALGLPIRDLTGGYRLFRREVLEELDLGSVASQGYCFQVDMAWRAVQAGFRVHEVPITFTERTHGASKMSGAIVAEALWRVTRWGASARLGGGTRGGAACPPEPAGTAEPGRAYPAGPADRAEPAAPQDGSATTPPAAPQSLPGAESQGRPAAEPESRPAAEPQSRTAADPPNRAAATASGGSGAPQAPCPRATPSVPAETSAPSMSPLSPGSPAPPLSPETPAPSVSAGPSVLPASAVPSVSPVPSAVHGPGCGTGRRRPGSADPARRDNPAATA